MAERLDIFEALNFANGDGREENDRTDDGMLFFGCQTTPSHPLFSCFTLGITRESFPIP